MWKIYAYASNLWISTFNCGEVKIDGKILGKEFSFPPSVGVFIEKPGFLDSYSGFQNLMMLASIKGQISGAEVKDVLKRVGLQDVMYKNIGNILLE